MSVTPDAKSRERLLRFDLAVQRNHLYVYSAALVTSLIGNAFGVFPLNMRVGFLVWFSACVFAALFFVLYRKGVSRTLLNPMWMATDTFFVTMGVYASGGIVSPWFVWYVATSGAAAFASGKRAAYIVSLGNAVAYVGVLLFMGQATWGDEVFLLGLCRMMFVFGASYFFLAGVANLQEKRARIRLLEIEQNRKVEELTRLAQELADANRRIEEADRLKSQFLANMSHELRTPMNSIIGFSEILVERLEGTAEPKHVGFLRHILASGQHLLAIINDILDLSKIEAGKMEIYPEVFQIRPVIESVCQMTRGMAKQQPVFVLDLPDDLPQIETDLSKFKQVLFNLLSNAVKFSPPRSPITVSARCDGAYVTVAVRDEGIGIAPEHHDVIFHEFRQVDGTARREFGGTGLGLALVKKFVELQGGRISVDSAVGAGSTFTFVLPVRALAAVITRTAAAPEATRSERVLVVEDDANAYELISSALGSAGYLPLRARHGEEALKLAREAQPVAVTLDLVLPGVDGWEVLKKLKGDVATRDIPVVIISMVDNHELGVALGADDYFIKPVDRDRLLQRIRQITSRGTSADGARLLLIDDDAGVHALLHEELTARGYVFDGALSGADGLRAARETAPDIIVLDLMMPGMSGFEVAAALKDDPRTANIPILVLTSKEITVDERTALQSKVTSFVQKGSSAREQLVTAIRRLVPHS